MTGSHNTGNGTESNMVGFRFKPTDEELVSDHLEKKVMGTLTPSRFVVDAEVYKVEPWHLPGTPENFFLHIRRVLNVTKVKAYHLLIS